jgi:hypothetical protein
VVRELVDRAVEAETGLDADREQVERVGELGADLLPAAARTHRDVDAREREAADSPGEREEQRAEEAHAEPDEQAQEGEAEREAGLEREERRRRDPAAEPGGHQLSPHDVDGHARVRAQRHPGEPARERNDDAIPERGALGAARDLRPRIRRRAPERVRPLAGTVAGELRDEEDRGAETDE